MTVTDHRSDTLADDDVAFVTEQIAQQRNEQPHGRTGPGAGSTSGRRQERAATMRPILWRLHFLGGFLAGPVVLMLCVSGILYAWYPQFDAIRFGDITQRSSPAVEVDLAQQVEAAQAANPDWAVYAVVPGFDDQNTNVIMDPPGGEGGFRGPDDAVHVYVDQTSGEVTGAIVEAERSDRILRKLHSSLLLGERVEPLTELAGAWFLATMFTGAYLWWPGLARRGSVAFAKRLRLTGRRNSKEWHTFLGLAFFVPMVMVAVTGLTWTQFSGDRVGIVSDGLAVPRSGADAGLAAPGTANLSLTNLDVTYDAALRAELVEPIQIVVPTDEATGWKATSADVTFPVERDQLVVDGTTGEVSSTFDYRDEHWFNKLRTAAILFHQAQLFGWPLQVFMTVLALTIAAMVVYGYRMWWQRRPAGGMGAPPSMRSWVRNAPLPLLALTLIVGWLLPTLGLSLIVWLVFEAGYGWWTQRSQASAVEAAKAAVIGGLGIAMLAAPGIGDGAEDPSTVLRLLAYAWSRPLGLAFLAVGLIGCYALAIGPGRRATT